MIELDIKTWYTAPPGYKVCPGCHCIVFLANSHKEICQPLKDLVNRRYNQSGTSSLHDAS